MHIHVRVLVLYYVVVFGTEKLRQADQRDDKRFIIPKKRMERKSIPEDFRTETCKRALVLYCSNTFAVLRLRMANGVIKPSHHAFAKRQYEFSAKILNM